MREQAQASGALTVVSGAEVLDITTEAGRVTGVRHQQGRDRDGQRGDLLRRLVGEGRRARRGRLALTPAVHQMISVGPIGLFAGTTGEISYPIVRDVDEGMYERQHGGDMEVGSYMHRPIIVPPETIPSNEEAVLSPTEMPFTADDFDPQLAASLELMPELLGDEKAGIRYAINGLISMTPDGHPLLGETPEVKGLWAAAASWIKEGPGCGRAVAELMSGKVPTVDVHEADVARFYPSSAHDRVRPRPRRRGVQQDVRHRAPRRAVRVAAPAAHRAAVRPGQGPRRGVLRDRPLGAAALVRVQRAAAREVRGHGSWSAPPSGSPAGGRRSSTPSTSPCATAPAWWTCPRSPSSTSPGPARSAGCSTSPSRSSTCRSAGPSTPRSSTRRAGSSPTSRSCGSARATSVSSPARPTAGGTPSGSATGCPTTRSSPTSARPGPRSGCGDPAQATSSPR